MAGISALNDFNRQFIFSLIQFYHETDAWLFGGIFRVVARHEDRYEVKLADLGSIHRALEAALNLSRANNAGQLRKIAMTDFSVLEILREPYSGRQFPGYDDIDL